MKCLVGLLFSALLLCADTPDAENARQLYDLGMRQTEAGKLADARGTFQVLADRYPRDPLAFKVEGAIDATLLFDEGQSLAKAGKYETARVAYTTLVEVYPESPLASRASAAMQALAAKEKDRLVVNAVEFRDLKAISADEVRAAMDAREVRLRAGIPYRSKDIEQAKVVLEEILAERGIAKARIATQKRSVAHDAVKVIFTVEKPRGSLLPSPLHWRRTRTDSAGI